MSSVPATVPRPQAPARVSGFDILMDPDAFSQAQRVAKMFADSILIPENLRGRVADVCIALTMAQRLGEDPLVIMQNIHFVKGKAGWNAAYIIARANRSGIFKTRIAWRVERKAKPLEFKRQVKDRQNNTWRDVPAKMPDMTVTAYAVLAESGEEVAYEVDSQMAIDDGWADNEKYSTLPDLMLRYRAATLLVRLYAQDVMLGYETTTIDELETVDVRVVSTTPARGGIARPAGATSNFAADVTAAAAQIEAPPPEPEPGPFDDAPEADDPGPDPVRAGILDQVDAYEQRIEPRDRAEARRALRIDAGVLTSALTTVQLRDLLAAYAEQEKRSERRQAAATAPGGAPRNLHTSRRAAPMPGEREPGSEG